MSNLRAGAAVVDITPPLPFDAQPNWRGRPSVGVYHSLEARACVLENSAIKVVIITADVLGLSPAFAAQVREAVGEALGCEPTNVVLNASHTHRSAAVGWPYKLGSAYDHPVESEAAYFDELITKYVTVARSANREARPASASGGTGRVPGLAVNRRERGPDGKAMLGWYREGFVDDEVPTLRIDDTHGKAIATILSFGAHPVMLGCRCPDPVYNTDPDAHFFDLSADFVGPLRQRVDLLRGGICLFLQGAAGNILPLEVFFDEPGPEVTFGERLALEAVHSVADAPPGEIEVNRLTDEHWSVTAFQLYRRSYAANADQVLRVAHRTVEWPFLSPPSLDELESELTGVNELIESDHDHSRLTLNNRLYAKNWLEYMIDLTEREEVPKGEPAELWAMRVGDCAIVAAPGEIFSETGYEVRKNSPAQTTLFAGYSSAVLGYVPTRPEYEFGGYEAALAQRTYFNPAPFAPEADESVKRVGQELLNELFND